MIGPNHELSSFAAVTTWAACSGVPPLGALACGALGAHTGDWPDLDHAGATITKLLRWVPYRSELVRDKNGAVRYRKPKPLPKRRPRTFWGRLLWLLRRLARWLGWSSTRPMRKIYYFPSWQMHRCICWVSGCIYDRCATDADLRDCTAAFGPAFRVHRGFAHSVWCALAAGCTWWFITMAFGAWKPGMWPALHPLLGTDDAPALIGEVVFLGMCSHVCGDGCTDFGVSPFAPLIKWPERNTVDVGSVRLHLFPKAWCGRRYPRQGLWEPLRFKVSHRVEKILIAPLCMAGAVLAALMALGGPEQTLNGLWRASQLIWLALA